MSLSEEAAIEKFASILADPQTGSLPILKDRGRAEAGYCGGAQSFGGIVPEYRLYALPWNSLPSTGSYSTRWAG